MDLGFSFGQRRLESSLDGPAMRDALKAQRLSQPGVLGQERRELLGFEGPQYHAHHGQQQKRLAGEHARAAPVIVRGGGHIVFFDLLHYFEQGVGGKGVEVGSHNSQIVQSVLALCYPRPIYAQASN